MGRRGLKRGQPFSARVAQRIEEAERALARDPAFTALRQTYGIASPGQALPQPVRALDAAPRDRPLKVVSPTPAWRLEFLRPDLVQGWLGAAEQVEVPIETDAVVGWVETLQSDAAPGLALQRPIDAETGRSETRLDHPGGRWHVVHADSGRIVVHGLFDLGVARLTAEHLARLVDWRRPIRDIVAAVHATPRVRAALLEARRRAVEADELILDARRRTAGSGGDTPPSPSHHGDAG